MMKKIIELLFGLIFGILFILLITPIGLMLRAMGIDFLDREINPERNSYWRKHR
jgi:multisubunit Na+/H+ antiporter MnhG subunit